MALRRLSVRSVRPYTLAFTVVLLSTGQPCGSAAAVPAAPATQLGFVNKSPYHEPASRRGSQDAMSRLRSVTSRTTGPRAVSGREFTDPVYE